MLYIACISRDSILKHLECSEMENNKLDNIAVLFNM